MTNLQLYLAIGVPVLVNSAAFIAVFALFAGRLSDLNARIGDVHARINDLTTSMNAQFADIRTRMATQAELRRVEEVLDARLKHLEERRL